MTIHFIEQNLMYDIGDGLQVFYWEFFVGGTKLQLRIACNSWSQKIKVIGQIRWE